MIVSSTPHFHRSQRAEISALVDRFARCHECHFFPGLCIGPKHLVPSFWPIDENQFALRLPTPCPWTQKKKRAGSFPLEFRSVDSSDQRPNGLKQIHRLRSSGRNWQHEDLGGRVLLLDSVKSVEGFARLWIDIGFFNGDIAKPSADIACRNLQR